MTYRGDGDRRTEHHISAHRDETIIHKITVEVHIGPLAKGDVPAVAEVDGRLDPDFAAVFVQHLPLNAEAFLQCVSIIKFSPCRRKTDHSYILAVFYILDSISYIAKFLFENIIFFQEIFHILFLVRRYFRTI